MASGTQEQFMTDESTAPSEEFGEIHTIARDRFGLVSGGTLGGGFGWLLDYVKEGKWERGIFGQADREFLLETPSSELTTASARSTRQRIRKRVLSTYFDARLLRYIDQRDRELIFQNARDAGYELHFREGFKEFIRFTYLGLLELETDIDIHEIIETAVREAEKEYALERGENVNFQVEIDMSRVEADSVEDLERRFTHREKLTPQELSVLVKSQHKNNSEDVEDAADISLSDALYYDARQPESDPHGRSWEDPDREEAEQIVEWLSSVFDEYDIEDYDDLEVALGRMNLIDEDLADELRSKLSRLPRAAPEFNQQLDWGSGLPESDTELLYQIQHNPENLDVETTLQQYARPPTAGPDWDPAQDEYLQKFIARVEAVNPPTGGEEGLERWQKVLDLAEFHEEEWADYMHERRVQKAKDAIREVFEEHEESFDPEHHSGGPSEEEIEEAVNDPEYDLTREDFEEEFGNVEPITDPPGRDDLDDVRTADEFREVFGRTHDSMEITFLEGEVGEKALAQALKELSEEWDDAK